MSGARYHVVALASSLVTLAVGVVVGAGPLTEAQSSRSVARLDALHQTAEQLRDDLAAARSGAKADHALVTSLAPSLMSGRLAHRTVVVVAAPGAPSALVRRTTNDLDRAGATVNATVQLGSDYVDPAKAQSPLEDLALQLVPPGVDFTDGMSPIDRVGVVLARSTVTTSATAQKTVDQKAAEVISGLTELKALTLTGKPGRLASLAVVVAGPAPGDGSDALLGLVSALDAGSDGVLVVGRADSATAHGLLAQIRTSDRTRNPSTVDTGGTLGGDLATVLGLAEQASGRAGDYGTGKGATAALPALPKVSSAG